MNALNTTGGGLFGRFSVQFLLERTALLGSVTVTKSSGSYRCTAVELERYDRIGDGVTGRVGGAGPSGMVQAGLIGGVGADAELLVQVSRLCLFLL